MTPFHWSDKTIKRHYEQFRDFFRYWHTVVVN